MLNSILIGTLGRAPPGPAGRKRIEGTGGGAGTGTATMGGAGGPSVAAAADSNKAKSTRISNTPNGGSFSSHVEKGQSGERLGAQQKWGPALLPAPICAETWICRCSLAWRPEGLPLFDPCSPAQASLPISGPARRQVQRPSAALLGSVPFASPAPRGSRELRWEDQLFRRLFRWSDLELALLLIAIRWRSVLPPPAAPSCRFRLSAEAGTSVPITHVTWPTFSSRESEKSESLPVDNGDIVHNSSPA